MTKKSKRRCNSFKKAYENALHVNYVGYTCNAVHVAHSKLHHRSPMVECNEVIFYQKLFGCGLQTFPQKLYDNVYPPDTSEINSVRLLALCFADIIYNSERDINDVDF